MSDTKEDFIIDAKIDSDYDFFLDYYKDKIQEMNELLDEVESLHKLHGWEFDLNDLRDIS